MELTAHTTTAATVAPVTEIVTWDFTATAHIRLHTVPVVIIIIDHWMAWVIQAVTIITTTTIPDIQDILDRTPILYIPLEVILTTTTTTNSLDIMDTTVTTDTTDTMDTMAITTTTQPTNIIITTTTAIVTATPAVTPAVTQAAESLDYLTANSTALTDIINWVHTIFITVFLSKKTRKIRRRRKNMNRSFPKKTHLLIDLKPFTRFLYTSQHFSKMMKCNGFFAWMGFLFKLELYSNWQFPIIFLFNKKKCTKFWKRLNKKTTLK